MISFKDFTNFLFKSAPILNNYDIVVWSCQYKERYPQLVLRRIFSELACGSFWEDHSRTRLASSLARNIVLTPRPQRKIFQKITCIPMPIAATASICFSIQGPTWLDLSANWRLRASLFCCLRSSSSRVWSRWGTKVLTSFHLDLMSWNGSQTQIIKSFFSQGSTRFTGSLTWASVCPKI